MLEAIEVGKPYPQPLELRDGMATQPHPSGIMSLVHLSRFQKGDAKAFSGPVSVAALQAQDDLPWLALRFHKNRLTLDGPILVGHRPDLREHLQSAGNLLQLVVLEGNRYTVRHIRALGLTDDLTAMLKTALGQDSHMGRLQTALLGAQRRYPTPDDVFRAATIVQDFD